jgi:hypothetical protein
MIDSQPFAPRPFTLLAPRSRAAPADLLAGDVRFSSPFADYHGRADVLHLFGLAGRVLHKPVVTDAATDRVWTYTSFIGRVEGASPTLWFANVTRTMVGSCTRFCFCAPTRRCARP